jgi:regulator of protease activity HflC (stomatin/prohibitin superfamily)
MQSAVATKHMADLAENMTRMGIEVIGVFVPEKRMKNDDIREQIAKQAVIGIRADAERAAADAKAYATVADARAQAEAKRQSAEAEAYTRVTCAKAEAEAIAIVTKAQAAAGDILGSPESTAARMALTDKTAAALGSAKVTIFSGAPSRLPFMLSGDS